MSAAGPATSAVRRRRWRTAGARAVAGARRQHHDRCRVADVAATGGRVLLTAAGPARAQLPVTPLCTRDVSLHGCVISRATIDDLAAAAGLINTVLAEGELDGRISDVLPLGGNRRGAWRLEAGGRLLLRP